MVAAKSTYKQVRLTITEEAGGRVSVRVMVKPVDASWTMKHTVWHHNWVLARPSGHWLGLVSEAFYAICGEALPPR